MAMSSDASISKNLLKLCLVHASANGINNNERVRGVFQDILKRIDSPIFATSSPGTKSEEHQLVHRIKKRLSRRNGDEEARFCELWSRLSARKDLNRFTEILQLLHMLTTSKKHSESTPAQVWNGLSSNTSSMGGGTLIDNGLADDRWTSPVGLPSVTRFRPASLSSTSNLLSNAASNPKPSRSNHSCAPSSTTTGYSSGGDRSVSSRSDRFWTTSTTTTRCSHTSKVSKNASTLTSPPESFAMSSARTQSTNDEKTPVPSARNFPGSMKPGVLPLISETELLRDVLYMLQGFDGRYIRFTASKTDFVFDRNVQISRPMKAQLCRILKASQFYVKIQRFVDERLDHISQDGRIIRSLASAFNEEISEYLRLVAYIYQQLDEPIASRLTMASLSVQMLSRKERLALISAIVDSCTNSSDERKRGGALISLVQELAKHGDADHVATCRRILTHICKPFHQMAVQWMTAGKLDDPYAEFMVVEGHSTEDQDFWNKKFSVRESMLPASISTELANQMLSAGQAVNFLQATCKDRSLIAKMEVLRKQLQNSNSAWLHNGVSSVERDIMADLVYDVYAIVNRQVMQVVIGEFKLLTHFEVLKKYLLLSQGDFAQTFMEYLLAEFEPTSGSEDDSFELSEGICEKIEDLRLLTDILHMSIKQSNASLEPEDIKDRLDVEIIETGAGVTWWESFLLNYKVEGPICAVLSTWGMTSYYRLFNFIWKLKRAHFLLSWISKFCLTQSRSISSQIPEVKGLLNSFCALTSEVNQFSTEMQYHFAYEVVESAWTGLQNRLSKATDLTQVSEAHLQYQQRCIQQCFLDESEDLRDELHRLLSLIIDFSSIHRRFVSAVHREIEQRNSFKESMEAKARSSRGFAISSEEQQCEAERRKNFVHQIVADFKTLLSATKDNYRQALSSFLTSLLSNDKDELRGLYFRLDYNQFYSKKDQRLDGSLKYAQMSKRLTCFTRMSEFSSMQQSNFSHSVHKS